MLKTCLGEGKIWKQFGISWEHLGKVGDMLLNWQGYLKGDLLANDNDPKDTCKKYVLFAL